jgi:hypothetical protein
MKKIYFLVVMIFCLGTMYAQNDPRDCAGAIMICGDGTFTANTAGIGLKQEVSSCGGSEHNSLWLKIHVLSKGLLGFDIMPLNPSLDVDYDFWVYGPNKSCGSLGTPIRCATTNPKLAEMTHNWTGLGPYLPVHVGPGPDGLGYATFLSVNPGDWYYIAIDRPVGDGGFELKWDWIPDELGAPLFSGSPQVNSIPDQVQCENFPGGGTATFELDAFRSLITADPVLNTVNFYPTLGDAVVRTDNTLPETFSTGNKTIFVRVTDKDTGCFEIGTINLVVKPRPTVTISKTETVCAGDIATVTFNGTPNAIVHYSIDKGTDQTIVLDDFGVATVSMSVLSAATMCELTNVEFQGCVNDDVYDSITINPCLSVGNDFIKSFDVTTYPNPFKNSFAIDVSGLTQENVQVKVYDMLGRMVEQREGSGMLISSQRMGQNYSTGIYNIFITQGDEVKTLRVIKE